jgi:TrbC/VIRB2 family.
MRKIKKFLVILISIPLVLSAEGLIPCKGTREDPCTACDLLVLFKNVVDFLLFTIIPLLAAIIIAWGAFRALLGMAQGKVEEWKKGKDVLIAVIIGIFIIYSAYALVSLFFNMIGVTSFGGWSPRNWMQINCTP